MLHVKMPMPFLLLRYPIQGDICSTTSNFEIGHLWKGLHIIFHVDNTTVVSELSSGSMQSPQVMNVVCMYWLIECRRIVHIGFTEVFTSGIASSEDSV